jgi:prepilin-type N-terminal cleavage/methylation domain-containing protein
MKIQHRDNAGFTLVEIMIVVAIIGLLAAIAIPNFAKARETAQREACKMNLKAIDSAKEAWATEFKKSSGEAVDETAVNSYLKGGQPECPGGGEYTYGTVGTPPTCSLGATKGHSL